MAALAATNVPKVSSLCEKHFLPMKKSPCEIYGCGGAIVVASINATHLLEIYCYYTKLCANYARSYFI